MKLSRVVRWEFSQNVRSKQFLIMTIMLPAIIGIAVFAVTQAMGTEVSRSDAPPPMIIGLFLAMILFLGAFMSGVMTMYGILKEKQNRCAELMLSTVSAWELMSGKMIGLGLTGLIQVTVWGLTAYFVVGMFIPVSLASLTPVHWITYPIYFVLGFLFIASIFGTVGAAIKDIHSGGAIGIVGIIPYVPMMFTAFIVTQPNHLWVRIASFIPPFAPGVMLLRLGAAPMAESGPTSIPTWEVALSLLSLAVGTFLMMRFAAKVFEVGMLMTGKTASLKELWRWGIRGNRNRKIGGAE